MKDLQETVNKIDEIVSWWLNLEKGYTNISHLDEIHRKLSGYYFYLSEIVADSYKDYLFSYIHKKVGLAKRQQGLIESGDSVTKAKEIAPLHEEMLLMDEAEAEANYNALKLKLNAVSKVLEAIRQRISNLKTELNNG